MTGSTYHQGCGQIFGSSAGKMLLTTRCELLLSCWQTAASAGFKNVHETYNDTNLHTKCHITIQYTILLLATISHSTRPSITNAKYVQKSAKVLWLTTITSVIVDYIKTM